MQNQFKISNQIYRHSQYELQQGEKYGNTTELGYQMIDLEIEKNILPKLRSLRDGSIVVIAQVSRPRQGSTESISILSKKHKGLIRTKQAQDRVWQRLQAVLPEANFLDVDNFRFEKSDTNPLKTGLASIAKNNLNVIHMPIYAPGLAPKAFLTPNHSKYRSEVLHDPEIGEDLEAERYLHLAGFENNTEDPTIRPEQAGAEVLFEVYRGMKLAQEISKSNDFTTLAHNPEIHLISIGHAVVSDSAIALFIQESLSLSDQLQTLGEIFDNQMGKKMIQHFESYEFTINQDLISLVYRQKTYTLPLNKFLMLLNQNLSINRKSLTQLIN